MEKNMEKLTFVTEDQESVDFYIIEETRVNGINYLLVTESEDEEDEEAEAYILKDTSKAEDTEACVLMRENIYDKFTPEDIAESINMSYSNFRKSFKQYTGIAPHQYMLQLKLSKIKDLLSSTEMSIQDIAMKLNFESADYFSYFFRSKTGINPLSYRKEIEKQREKAKKNSH